MGSCVVNTVIEWCNDTAAMRRFYTDLLGMTETFYDETKGWLTYESNDLQVVFVRASAQLPTTDEFAKNPAYEGGTVEGPSWVLQVPGDDFDATVQRLKAAGVPTHSDEPSEHAGWKQFYVLDPMGRTIEVSAAPKEEEVRAVS